MVSTLGVFIIPRIVDNTLLRMLDPADLNAVADHPNRHAALAPMMSVGPFSFPSMPEFRQCLKTHCRPF
jgi:hypothetical protein